MEVYGIWCMYSLLAPVLFSSAISSWWRDIVGNLHSWENIKLAKYQHIEAYSATLQEVQGGLNNKPCEHKGFIWRLVVLSSCSSIWAAFTKPHCNAQNVSNIIQHRLLWPSQPHGWLAECRKVNVWAKTVGCPDIDPSVDLRALNFDPYSTSQLHRESSRS